ncbi:hypothetical protein VaNZ11_014613 [Volvox africanus]|uniref:glycerophosphodiester phosphodiesterase n=1 Tax=Volvox africanus TaxID=51714 RepID=A0ABQ5SL61_9CHLO|nr:hypothetical protein VaNZ11_014613 [Volvox africanus]
MVKEGYEDSVQNMSEKQGFVLIAHRGNSTDVPENTIAAFDSAVDSGFPHFETDCQVTADGVVVILHDEQLGRTTPGVKGAVAEATWTDLRELDVGSWFSPDFSHARIPLLTEVLQRYWGRAHIHLELKSQQPELPGAVARLLSETGWVAAACGSSLVTRPAAEPLSLSSTSFPQNQQQGQGQQQQQQGQGQQQQHGVDIARQTSPDVRCPDAAGPAEAPVVNQLSSHPHRDFDVPGLTITSFHLNQLCQSLQLLPDITHGWLVHELTDERIQEALAMGCRQLCPRANVLTADTVQRAVSAGLSVRAWGIKDIQVSVSRLLIVGGKTRYGSARMQ